MIGPERLPARVLWMAFIFWTGLVLLIWLTGFGEGDLRSWSGRRETVVGETPSFAAWLRLLDPAWLILAAANVYASLAERYGIRQSRRWMLAVFGVALGFGASSAWINLPLGEIRFTSRLGMALGPVPIGWPLLACAVLLGSRELVLWRHPRATPLLVGIGVAVLATVSAINLEMLAWKVRGWWLWSPGRLPAPELPPATSILTWAVGGFLVGYCFREARVAVSGMPIARRAVSVLLILNAVWLLANFR